MKTVQLKDSDNIAEFNRLTNLIEEYNIKGFVGRVWKSGYNPSDIKIIVEIDNGYRMMKTESNGQPTLGEYRWTDAVKCKIPSDIPNMVIVTKQHNKPFLLGKKVWFWDAELKTWGWQGINTDNQYNIFCDEKGEASVQIKISEYEYRKALEEYKSDMLDLID